MQIHHGAIARYWCAGLVLLSLGEDASLRHRFAYDDTGHSVVNGGAERTQNDHPSRYQAEAGFDVGYSQLAVPFRGNSVEWVLRFGTLAPRMAFESDVDYAARRRSFRSEVFAFVPDRFDVRYDNTNETLTVIVSPSFECAEGQPPCSSPAFDIHRTKLIQKSRAGPAQWSREQRPTASERGAVIATTRAWKQTQIVATDAELQEHRQPLTFLLKVPHQLARRTKSNIAVALVCMPKFEQLQPAKDPLVPEATSARKKLDGSFQLEDESTMYYVTLRVTLLQVWLFDRSTGVVYNRYTPRGVVVPRG